MPHRFIRVIAGASLVAVAFMGCSKSAAPPLDPLVSVTESKLPVPGTESPTEPLSATPAEPTGDKAATVVLSVPGMS